MVGLPNTQVISLITVCDGRQRRLAVCCFCLKQQQAAFLRSAVAEFPVRLNKKTGPGLIRPEPPTLIQERIEQVGVMLLNAWVADGLWDIPPFDTSHRVDTRNRRAGHRPVTLTDDAPLEVNACPSDADAGERRFRQRLL
jgi:hypothetical protein